MQKYPYEYLQTEADDAQRLAYFSDILQIQ
jgi:hypothetical protein